ncbi:unnamed protein product, partial [Phaeothamnion confervicola]
EQRGLIRLRCDYQVECESGPVRLKARVVDIGLNGMRLFLDDRLGASAKLRVHSPASFTGTHSESVDCHVRWCRKRRKVEGYEIGVQYDGKPGSMRRSWVKFLLKELGFDERSIFTRRKSIRADGSIRGQMIGPEGRALTGTIRNLGAGGALFETPNSLPSGTPVRLRVGPWRRLQAIELPAVVLSARDSQCTLRFGELTASQVRRLGNYVLHLLKEQEA